MDTRKHIRMSSEQKQLTDSEKLHRGTEGFAKVAHSYACVRKIISAVPLRLTAVHDLAEDPLYCISLLVSVTDITMHGVTLYRGKKLKIVQKVVEDLDTSYWSLVTRKNLSVNYTIENIKEEQS
ncbi:uncharacterized protein [Coffea arabica]|uniref:Uncharacterized protein n=1 Tax=Coffea arabica TaxID=13443 RepID=A0ABM4USQ4_COFAR